MASTLVKLDVHLIFHVKSTAPRLRPDDLPRLHAYIGGVVKGLGGVAIAIGGMPDHVHILCGLPKTVALADFVRGVKADSSKWLKRLGGYDQFAWQEGYGAFSVSPSLLDKTIRYIGGQAEHHKKRTFQEEYKLFLEAYGISYDERYVFSD